MKIWKILVLIYHFSVLESDETRILHLNYLIPKLKMKWHNCTKLHYKEKPRNTNFNHVSWETFGVVLISNYNVFSTLVFLWEHISFEDTSITFPPRGWNINFPLFTLELSKKNLFIIKIVHEGFSNKQENLITSPSIFTHRKRKRESGRCQRAIIM